MSFSLSKAISPFPSLYHYRSDYTLLKSEKEPLRLASKRRRALAAILALVLVTIFTLLRPSRTVALSKGIPVVNLSYGSYAGTAASDHVTVFRGLRFAAPPVGTLRWRAPVAPDPFEGVEDATESKPSCNDAEDCLFLDVYSPSNATRLSKLPVWLYIQGGGYNSLCCNGNVSEVVSTGNVVVVNINYRVGALGFLSSKRLQAAGDLNVGLLDQRAAMAWTRAHIEEFGGDHNHIVIHGNGAGAGSVLHHLTAHGGRNDNLFVGAVVQSPYVPPSFTPEELEWQFRRYAEEIGCGGYIDAMPCFRSKDFTTVRSASKNFPWPDRQSESRQTWGPSIDGEYVQNHILDLFEHDHFIHVPVLIGHVTSEGSLWAPHATTSDEVEQFFNELDPTLTPQQRHSIVEHYPQHPTPQDADYHGLITDAYSDSTFVCPAIEVSRAIARHSNAWSYTFNVSTASSWENGLGAYQTVDLTAVFGPYLWGEPSSEQAVASSTYNKDITDMTMSYFLSFVKNLTPNTLKSISAPQFDQFLQNGHEQRLDFQHSNVAMATLSPLLQKRCQFWHGIRHSADPAVSVAAIL